VGEDAEGQGKGVDREVEKEEMGVEREVVNKGE